MNKLSPSRFYLTNIILYTCLLAFPLSAAIKQVNQTKSSQPSNTSKIDNVDEWLEIDETENSDQKSSLETTKYEQIMASINKLNSKNEQLEEQIAELQDMLQNIPIEAKGKDQMTSFLYAAKKGQLKIAKRLKEQGANIHAKDAYGNSALHMACLSGSVEMTNWLLDECKIGIEARGQCQETPFLCAAEKGQLAIAKLLRQQGAEINAKDEDGDNALHLTCLSGSVEMATWLLDVCKIGIETKGFNQRTPFLCAAQKGQLAIAKRLKEWGANINAEDDEENNALHLACLYSGSVGMTTWLLDVCNIGIEAKGRFQKTPFLCAAQGGKLQIAKLLRQRDADINAKDEDGDNALHYACYFSGSVPMTTWLLDVCKPKKVTWLSWLTG